VDGEGWFSKDEVERLVQDSATEGRVDPRLLRVIWYDSGTGLGIVRCSHRSVGALKTAASAVTEISGRRATMRTMGVSGTIRALRKKFIWTGF